MRGSSPTLREGVGVGSECPHSWSGYCPVYAVLSYNFGVARHAK